MQSNKLDTIYAQRNSSLPFVLLTVFGTA